MGESSSPAADFPFSEYTGATGWWDVSDIDTLWQDAGVTPVTANNDPLYRMDDKIGLAGNRYMDRDTGDYVYLTNQQNGLPMARKPGAQKFASLAISNFISASEAFLFIVFTPNSPSTGEVFFQDASGYFGMFHNANNKAQLRNYVPPYGYSDEVDVASGQAVLLTAWHAGGVVYMQKNGETVVAGDASGNTQVLTGNLEIFRTNGGNSLVGEAGIANQYDEDEKNSLVASLLTKWGI